MGLSHSTGGRAGTLDLTERGWQMPILCPKGSISSVHPGDIFPRLLKHLLKDLAALCVRVPNQKHLETSILSLVEYLYSSMSRSYENARTTIAHNHRTRLPKDAYMRFS